MQHFDSIADTAKKTDKASLEGKQGQPQKPYILLFDFSIVLAAWTDSTKNRYKRLSNILSKDLVILQFPQLKLKHYHVQMSRFCIDIFLTSKTKFPDKYT